MREKGIISLIMIVSITLIVLALVQAAPKAVYTDAETGHEVWQMTNWDGYGAPAYYHQPQYSPNGKFIVYQSSRYWPTYLAVVNADGSGEKIFGDINQWRGYIPSGDSDLWDECAGAWGWWSADSAFYYTIGGVFKINSSSDQVSRGSNDASKLPFNYPMLSPDGRTLFGLSNRGDLSSGSGKLKFIDVDGSNYREFDAPYAPSGTGFDVTHGWLGNNHAWYMNKDNRLGCCLDYSIVISPQPGAYEGYLEVDFPGNIWNGYFSHITFSAEAYNVADGAGLIAGHGSGFKRANTLFSSYTDPTRRDVPGDPSNNPTYREFIEVVNTTKYPNFKTHGVHWTFSPNGNWIVVSNVQGDCSKLALYPIDKQSSPVWLASYGPSSVCDQESGYGAYATWSPDSTKGIFGSNYQLPNRNANTANTNDVDLYVAIAKKPDAPASLAATHLGNSQMKLTWKPASQHREIKEYEIHKATSATGTYTKVATVPEVYTYLNAPSKISATETTINVDSTTDFPSQGVIEILGLSTEQPTEIISYTGKTATSFTGCSRGQFGTQAAEHYNDAFVWRYTGDYGYTGSYTAGDWFKVRSVEWSGLTSEYSQPINLSTGSQPPSCAAADLNCDTKVDLSDLNIVANDFGKSSGFNNAKSDTNNDGIVDIYDVVYVASRFT